MQDFEAIDGLIGRVYDEVTAATPWHATLERIRETVSAQTLVLQMSIDRRQDQSYFLAAGVRTGATDIAVWEQRSRDQHINLALPPGRVTMCNNYAAQRQREGFLELIRRYDVARGMSAAVTTLGSVEYSIHALRPSHSDPFGEDDARIIGRLAPHIARAITMRASLGHARAAETIYGETLDQIGIGLVMFDAGQTLMLMNDRAANIDRRGILTISRDGIHASDRGIDQALQSAIQTAHAAKGAPDFHAAITLGDGVHASIKAGTAHEPTLGRETAAVTILLHETRDAPPETALLFRQLFGFTPTEAAIAIHLVNGHDLRDIQSLLAIKYTTLRSHLNEMFLKTHCNRQTELVRRLTALRPLLH